MGDPHQILRRAGLLAGLAMIAVVPYAYRSAYTFADAVRRTARLSPEEVLRADLISLATLIVLAALVGSAFSERYRLGGLGRWPTLGTMRLHLVLAPVVGVVSYLAFGRVLATRLPGTFPEDLGWALAYAVKGAIFDEVVARYGLMTIFAGLTRPAVANLLQATFFTATIWKGLGFFGVDASYDAYFLLSVVSSFGLHLYLGSVYARHGLLPAMVLHFLYDLRFLLHALLLLAIPGSR
ncbi:MAG: CPBP family intramembrane metalloprotease [Deltaproteobacteria bacterium]|nr:CPBP family intramembrane metalloprotease [Deltaproteobacteria bacterium]